MSEVKKKAVVQPRLKAFVKAEMKRRGWGVREVARRGGLDSHSSIGRAISDDEQIGYHIVVTLAQAFNRPLANMLELAELLPATPPETKETRLLDSIYRQLGDRDKRELLRYAEWLLDR